MAILSKLDLSTKRKLVKNAIEDHRIRGTPAAVEKLFADVFDGAVVKEWWEFGGNPYEFRIEQIGRMLATESDYQDFHLALNVAKNSCNTSLLYSYSLLALNKKSQK